MDQCERKERGTESNDRTIEGTTEWQRYEVVLDVPEDAANISFGISLFGTGTVWLNTVKLEVVGSDAPTHRDEPANLNFENR